MPRRSLGVVVLVLALGAASVLLHERVRRSSTAKCPFGYDANATPAQREAARRVFADAHRGTIAARSKLALEWPLDVTTRDQLDAWARGNGVACVARGPDLECTHVENVSTLWLGFDADAHLVALTAFHDLAAGDAVSAYATIVRGQTARTGPPARVVDHDVTRGALVQSSAEWRFIDAWARASVANVGHDRFVVIEDYRSLR